MSKQKIGGDLNRLECGRTEKTFTGTWSFKERVDGESKVQKNENTEEDTFIIHDTAVCSHFLLDRLLYA